MNKTIYISGPITDLSTGQPREGWQQDFLNAEAKLRRMGFNVINPMDIAREVEEANRWQWECTFHPCTSTGEPFPPTRADYIMACLQRMKLQLEYDLDRYIYRHGDTYVVKYESHVQIVEYRKQSLADALVEMLRYLLRCDFTKQQLNLKIED